MIVSETLKRLCRIGLVITVCGTTGSTVAFDPADEATIERNRKIVARTDGAEGIFTVEPNGNIRHIQSGLLCPAQFPHVAFWQAQIYASPQGPGTDVGCDYGRFDDQGRAVSKLTIFAIKNNGATLDEAFATYKAQVERTYPGAIESRPSVTMEGPSSIGEFRSVEYRVPGDGVEIITDLVVAVRSGWIIEIRATFLRQGIVVTTPEDMSAADATRDLAGHLYALLSAISSVNGGNAKP